MSAPQGVALHHQSSRAAAGALHTLIIVGESSDLTASVATAARRSGITVLRAPVLSGDSCAALPPDDGYAVAAFALSDALSDTCVHVSALECPAPLFSIKAGRLQALTRPRASLKPMLGVLAVGGVVVPPALAAIVG
jgi:hypothetical protein